MHWPGELKYCLCISDNMYADAESIERHEGNRMIWNFMKKSDGGYSLIEMIVVIIIIGILATVVLKSLGKATDVSRTEETKQEMELLANAIAGNPELISGGTRSDYGYFGDVGALPPNWDALMTNPGYATWAGPYIKDEFAPGAGDAEFKRDGWGSQYSNPASISFSSTGGGFTITKNIANSSADLFANSVSIVITDLDNSSPGAAYKDSVRFLITIPNGSGSYMTKIGAPGADGFCQIDSIPIGNHIFRTVFDPMNDTLTRQISVNPGQDIFLNINYYSDVW
jgi:prepilin-type N-terminal cleavage/methylation domain-containing protein